MASNILHNNKHSENTFPSASRLKNVQLSKEEFEDMKGATKIHISKKNRQHNGIEKKYTITINDQ